MTKQEAVNQFRRVYPEDFITILNLVKLKNGYLIRADFPDGEFYFIVNRNYVSNSLWKEEEQWKAKDLNI